MNRQSNDHASQHGVTTRRQPQYSNTTGTWSPNRSTPRFALRHSSPRALNNLALNLGGEGIYRSGRAKGPRRRNPLAPDSESDRSAGTNYSCRCLRWSRPESKVMTVPGCSPQISNLDSPESNAISKRAQFRKDQHGKKQGMWDVRPARG
jgi:hypothetical protein